MLVVDDSFQHSDLLQLLEAANHFVTFIPDMSLPQHVVAPPVAAAAAAASAVVDHSSAGVLKPGISSSRQPLNPLHQQQLSKVQAGVSQQAGGQRSPAISTTHATAPGVPQHHIADAIFILSKWEPLVKPYGALEAEAAVLGAFLEQTIWASRPTTINCLPRNAQHIHQATHVAGNCVLAPTAVGVNFWALPPLKDTSCGYGDRQSCHAQPAAGTSRSSLGTDTKSTTTTAAGHEPTAAAGIHTSAVLSSSSNSSSKATTACSALSAEWQYLVNKVLCHARVPWTRSMTEREWLRGCETAWRQVQGCSELLEYVEVLHRGRYAGAASRGVR